MRWECDGKQKERESGPQGEIAPAYQINVHHHQPAWRYHIWGWHLAERGSKSCLMKEGVATTELKKTSLICYFLRLAKAKCGAFDIAFPQTILLSFAIQSQLSDSDSSDAPRTLWLLMAIHAKCQRISTFSYHFILENIFLFSKKPPRTFNGSSWSKTFEDKV